MGDLASVRDGVIPKWFTIPVTATNGFNEVTLKINIYPILQEHRRVFHFWESRRFLQRIGYNNAQGCYKILATHEGSFRKEAPVDQVRPREESRTQRMFA